MKKYFVFGMMTALALSFAACSSDDAVVENNPTFDGTNVKADFAFNIAKKANTRMNGTYTQENGNFRGIQDAYLVPFKGVPADGAVAISKNYALGDITGISNTSSSKVYPLSIPVGTDNFVFYALAKRNAETNAEVGKVNINGITAGGQTRLNNVKIGLQSIFSENEAAILADEAKFVDYLNSIASAEGWSATAGKVDIFQALGKLYTNLTTINSGELRSGSAQNILRMVQDLYHSVTAIINMAAPNPDLAEVYAIAQNIQAAIEAGDLFDITGEKTDAVFTFKDDALASFPANYNLPDGAAALQWNDGVVSYNRFPYYAAGIEEATVSVYNYMYPAEIVYFDNSPLRATDDYKEVADYPTTVVGWDTEADWTAKNWTDKEVKASTRAVAMTNNINYGVAMLKSTVMLAEDADTMADNRAVVLGKENYSGGVSEDEEFVIDENSFELKGLLIGGQPTQVDWNLVSSSNNHNAVIYDKELTFNKITFDKSQENYTLVLDNWFNGDQKDVLVCLELVNNLGKDFYGKQNLVPAGSIFYLVTKLSLEGKTFTPAVRNDSYRITNEDVTRVFIQDYMTTANFKITKDALKNAHNTIPDLRTTLVTFGLSVDLDWEQGLEFDAQF
ncbi:MAG: hypothetical protein IJV24_05885 [Prevotella sp.]|nr:hypothetical protein [Prevotella sp.]